MARIHDVLQILFRGLKARTNYDYTLLEVYQVLNRFDCVVPKLTKKLIYDTKF